MAQVVLGGSGKAIIGKAILAAASGGIDWQNVPVCLRLKTATEPGPRPKRDDFSSRQAYVEATGHFFEANRAQRRFGAFCDRDGSFRLQDVPAGTYQLEIKLRGFKPDSVAPNEFSNTQPEIGALTREINVPDVPEGPSAEVLDLGILELVPQHDSALLPR